jgi:hypothetical protein
MLRKDNIIFSFITNSKTWDSIYTCMFIDENFEIEVRSFHMLRLTIMLPSNLSQEASNKTVYTREYCKCLTKSMGKEIQKYPFGTNGIDNHTFQTKSVNLSRRSCFLQGPFKALLLPQPLAYIATSILFQLLKRKIRLPNTNYYQIWIINGNYTSKRIYMETQF